MSARDLGYGIIFTVGLVGSVAIANWVWAAANAAALVLLCTDAICTAIREAAKR